MRRLRQRGHEKDFVSQEHAENTVILDKSLNLDSYLKSMEFIKNKDKKVYEERYDDLQEVLDYQQSLILNKSECLSYPISQASRDVEYIKRKKAQHDKEFLAEKFQKFLLKQKDQTQEIADVIQQDKEETMPIFLKSLRLMSEKKLPGRKPLTRSLRKPIQSQNFLMTDPSSYLPKKRRQRDPHIYSNQFIKARKVPPKEDDEETRNYKFQMWQLQQDQLDKDLFPVSAAYVLPSRIAVEKPKLAASPYFKHLPGSKPIWFG